MELTLAVLACFAVLAACQSRGGAVNGSNSNMVRLGSSTPQSDTSDDNPVKHYPTPTQTLLPEVSATPTQTATPEATYTPTATATPLPTPTPAAAPFLDTFVQNLQNGNAGQVVGVYVEDVMALRVVQQPSSDASYVSTLANTATYFRLVQQMTGNTGLLAHNYLAGTYFFDLQPGQIITLIYGDGTTEEYMVSYAEEYQALSPNSPTSNFVSISSGETLSSTDLFYRVYGGSTKTTFQTCIAQGNEDSWGRLFVISPLE